MWTCRTSPWTCNFVVIWCSCQQTISTTCSPLFIHHGDWDLGWCGQDQRVQEDEDIWPFHIQVQLYSTHVPSTDGITQCTTIHLFQFDVVPQLFIYLQKCISCMQEEQKNENMHILTVQTHPSLTTLLATKSTQYTSSVCPRRSALILYVFKSNICPPIIK